MGYAEEEHEEIERLQAELARVKTGRDEVALELLTKIDGHKLLLSEFRAERNRALKELEVAEGFHKVAVQQRDLAWLELTAQRVRIDELLALVSKLSRETPYDGEGDDARRQVGVLMAEIGTLRAEVAELKLKVPPPGPACGGCGEPLGAKYYAGTPTSQGKMDFCFRCHAARG